jgi:uncharacterized protein
VPRAVLDTNVLVSALISPGGPSAALLLELRAGAFELIVSPLLLEELEEVLARPKLRSWVTLAETTAYLALIRGEATLYADPPPSGSALCPDPDDEFLIDLARSTGAGAIVSGDRHLLDLRPALPVMTPAAFLALLTA